MRIALYQPDIPQNTGNIFRLAACLGVSVDVIEPAGFFFDDKRLQRSLMDYMDHLDYKRHVDWETFYQWCKVHNYRLILLTTKSQKNITNLNTKIMIFYSLDAKLRACQKLFISVRMKDYLSPCKKD